MIRSFRDKDLEMFFYSQGQIHADCVPSQLRKIVYRKLQEINQARDTRDLRNVPSNHLEKLSSSKKYSIRVNQQYRLIFLWQNNYVYEVEINKHDKKY